VCFIIIAFGYFLVLGPEVLAEHFKKRPKGGHGHGPGPGQHELVLKKSNSEEFDDDGHVIVKGAHVPSLSVSDNIVYLYYQWFPKDPSKNKWFDHIGVSISRDSGSTWDNAVAIKIKDIPQNLLGRQGKPMDPTAVILANGQIRLFFTLEPNQPHNRIIGDSRIYSALSNDGINFVYEPGFRFKIDNIDLRDPAVAYFKNKWHLYAPNQKRNGTGYYATSTDGLNFVRQADVSVSEGGDWLGNAVAAEEKLYFFGTVWIGYSSNGSDWDSTRSRGLGPDPAVGQLKNGNWLGVSFRRMNR